MKLALLLALVVLVGSAYADAGPGPAAPSLKITLFDSGQRYTGDANATFLCSAAKERGPPTGAVSPGDMPLACSGGVCTIDQWYYKFNPCFASAGRIEVIAQNGSAISGEITMEAGGSYEYNLDISDGSLSGKGKSGVPCVGGVLMFGVAGAALFLSSRAGQSF